MIENMIKEGKIVPSEVTIKLLQQAMIKNENDKFLIDGFPRNEENRAAFENVVSSSTPCTSKLMFFHFSLLITHIIVQQLLPVFHHNLRINDFARLLIASHFLRQKFRLHLCYSSIVPRRRWKDVFWDAMRFHSSLLSLCLAYVSLSKPPFSCFQQFILFCRVELMTTSRLSGRDSKFLLNPVCL